MTNILKKGIKALKRVFVGKPVDRTSEEVPETPETQALNRAIDARVAAAVAYAGKWRPMERDGVAYRYGLQGKLNDDGTWPQATDNQMWHLLSQETAIMSQSRPKMVAKALKKEDADDVKIAEQAINWLFIKGIKGEMLRLRAHIDGQTHGHWVTAGYWDDRAKWNDEKREWEGRIRVDLLSPSAFYGDPLATEITPGRCQFAFTERLIPTTTALRKWPEYRETIIAGALKEGELKKNGLDPSITGRLIPNQPAGEYRSRDTSTPQALLDDGRMVNALNDGANPTFGEETEDERKLPGYVRVLEMIFCDEEEVKEPRFVDVDRDELIADGRLVVEQTADGPRDVNPDIGEEYNKDTYPTRDESYMAPKYPHGRHVLRFGTRGIVHDAPWDLEHWLWTLGVRGFLPHTWHGENAIEAGKHAQDLLNQLHAYVLDHLENNAVPEKKVEENTLYGDDDMENPGSLIAMGPKRITKIKANKMAGYDTVPGVPFSPALVKAIEDAKQTLKDIIGLQDVKQGKGKAPTLGQDLMNETNSRLRTAIQDLLMDDFIVRLMEQVWELAQENWSEGHTIRIIGEDGNTEGFDVTMDMLNAEFELSLEVGSVVPFDRERRKTESSEVFAILAELGRPDLGLKWLLEAYEVPNAKEIMDAMEEAVKPPAEPGEGGAAETEPESEPVAAAEEGA